MATVLLLPKNLISAAAGYAFGLVGGVGLVWVAAVLGACLSFWLGRRLGRDGVARIAGRHLARLDDLVERHGIIAVLVARLIPVVPFTAVNYGSGLTAISFRAYLLATAVGIVPGTVAYVSVGAYGADPTSPPFLLAAGALLALSVGGYWLARHRNRGTRAPSTIRPPSTRSARRGGLMLDAPLRAALDRPLAGVAARLDRAWVTPDRITLTGLGLGLAGAVSAGLAWWPAALVLWLLSRAADGLDGPLARRRRASGTGDTGEAGGFLDITADFLVYGAFVVGVGVGWGGSLLPFLAVLLAYYINGTAFLAFSSISERTGRRLDDGRSLSFLGGLAEGAETIVVHSLWVLLPQHAGTIAWVWAAVVLLSGLHRMLVGYRTLRRPPA